MTYFGHHKCASVWIHAILNEVCKELSKKIEYVHSPKQFNRDLKNFIEENRIDFLTYANADIEFVSQLENFKGFHVIRDPRDIAVSSYFSHLHSHSTDNWAALVKHREKLQNLQKSEGLFLDIEFITPGFKRLEKWNYTLPNVMEVKMEELTQDPYNKFVEIFDFLGIIDKKTSWLPIKLKPGKIASKKLAKILRKKRFSVLSGGRKPGKENAKHHFRKGVPGDWVNHFNEDHKKYFKKKFNPLLIKLGYEKDDNW
jgi:hypothetical protein